MLYSLALELAMAEMRRKRREEDKIRRRVT
jgi:hypothetical protein